MSGTHGAKVGPAPLPAAFYAIAAAVLAADQAVKAIIISRVVPGTRLTVIPGFLSITHSRNPGAAFGMLPSATVGLIVAGVLIVAILLIYGRRVAACRPLWVGLALQVGGALGNLIDRIFRGPQLFQGRVVDFIDVQLTRTYTWPTFNIADIGITVGALLIAFCIITRKDTPAGEDRPAPGR
jgi:signal peptidase II